MLKLSNWLYGLLLYSFPMPFRVRFGDTMRQTFRDQMRDALKQYGKAGALELWVFTCFDVLLSALAEHKRETIEMPIQKLFRWSGPAIALGGGLWAFGSILVFSYLETRVRFTWADTNLACAVTIVPVPFLIWGLIGLNFHQPRQSRPLSALATLLAIGGQVVSTVAVISLFLDIQPINSVWAPLTFGGFFSFLFGIAIMGLISLRNDILNRLSFTPILLAVLGFIMLIDQMLPIDASNEGFTTTSAIIFRGLFGASYLLLGFAMWKAHEKQIVQNQIA